MSSFFANPYTLFVIGLSLLGLFFAYFASDKDRTKRNIGTILFLGICALCAFAFIPPKERLKGGIDILGGSSFTLRVQEKELKDGSFQSLTNEQVDQAISVIEKRLDSMGTKDLLIARQGHNRILVQMPGVEPGDAESIRETLEKVAKLEFREVHTRNGEPGADGKTLAQRVADGQEIVPGYRIYHLAHKGEDGSEIKEPILLRRNAALGGSDISNAYPSQQQNDAVNVTLNSAGADKMIALTKGMRIGHDRLAIVLDGEVISAPTVQAVLAQNISISGLHEPGETRNLANALMNPLENPLIVEAESQVSASYGSAIVEEGIWAGLIGIGFTFLFVLLYYRAAGLIALTGLIVNGIILFGVMAMFGFTFTLPGIAGMILTIGMAVDANVLIYERLREEIQAGKSVKNAIFAAYEKAFTAIFDSNITSLITAVILFWLASGMIKGFAITLTIGLIASMFSAILVTRVLFRWGVDTGAVKKLSFMNLIPQTNIDFLGTRKIAVTLSIGLMLATIGLFAVKQDKIMGIDFTGGTMIQFQLGENEIPMDDINKAINSLTLTKEAYPQEVYSPATGGLLTVRCETSDADKIEDALRKEIPLLGEKTTTDGKEDWKIAANKEVVSELIGGTFLKQSLIALGFGLVGILIYIAIRFEWSFAVGGFLSTIHDVVVTLGIIILMGQELTLIHVGAILTVAGYSLNDTIVIYDRIRENIQLRGGSIKDIMNEAINATLSRTVLTSSTTIITVIVLLIVSQPLRDFSVTILVGIIVGTYSSVFIASPIVLWWSGRTGGDLRRDVLPKASTPLIETPQGEAAG